MTYEPVDRGPLDEQFWSSLRALGPYAQRPRCKFTIGSEMRPAQRNPMYQPAPPPVVPAQRRPSLAELVGDSIDRAAAKRRFDAESKRAAEDAALKRAVQVRYGHRNGRTAGGIVPRNVD